jgi:hypothetical protein
VLASLNNSAALCAAGLQAPAGDTARDLQSPAHRRDLALCLLLAALCLGFFWPVFTGQVVVPADGIYIIDGAFASHRPAGLRAPVNTVHTPDLVYQMYVWRLFTADSMRAGYLPLWNPYSACGAPLLANDQSAVLNPTNFVLNLLLSPARAQTVFVLLCLLAAALFTYGLVRSLGGAPVGAFVAGLTYGFGGFMFVWLGYPLAATALWLPALLWATHRLALRPTLAGAAVVGIIIGWQFLSGHLGTSLQLLAFWGVFTAYEFLSRRRARSPCAALRAAALQATPHDTGWAGRFAAAIVLGLALGIGLGAPQVVPFKEYFGLTGISQAGFSRWISDSATENTRRALLGDWWFLRSVARGELALLFLPERHGNPAFGDYRQYPGYGCYPERTIYVGTIALFALLSGLIWRPPPGYRRFFLISAWVVLGILFHLPVLNIVTYLPVLSAAAPHRMRFILALCASITLGLALPDWFPERPRGEGKRGPRLWLAASGLALVLALAAGSTVPLLAPGFHALSRPDLWLRLGKLFAPVAAAAVLCLLLLLALRRQSWRGPLVAALVATTVLDLFLFGLRYHGTARQETILPQLPAIQEARLLAGRYRIAGPANVFAPNLAMGYGMYDTRVYDPISVGRYVTLVETLTGIHPRRGPTAQAVVKGWDRPAPNLERLASVRCAWHWDGLRDATLRVIPNSLPRAYVASSVRASGPAEALGALAAGLDPRQVTLIEAHGASRAAEHPIRPAELAAYSPDRVVLTSEAERSSWLVLTDTYYPGWKAKVNGRAVPISIANYIFRAVPVPAGKATVTLTYEPSSYRLGLFAGLLSLAVAAALLTATLSPRPRRPLW